MENNKEFTSQELTQYKKNFNDKDFWKKLRRMAYKVGSKTIYYALVLYYTLTDENTPARYKAVIAGALG